MADSIVEDSVLVEQFQGKTYVTLGIGLMSNVNNVRMQIKGNDGNYRNVEFTQTGTCERDDTCNHYRFEVDSCRDRELYQSYFVCRTDGRDVFFIKLDMASGKKGKRNFVRVR